MGRGAISPEHSYEPFPERDLDGALRADPPHALARIDEIFRQIALLDGVEPDWRLAAVEAEIDSIRAALNRLPLGTGGLFRLRLGAPRTWEVELVQQAANLQLRWGLALMRTGDVDRRVWGAERVREAAKTNPSSPVPVLILAGCQEIGGFWSNEREVLDEWVAEHGPNDLVDLQRLRRRERSWAVERDRKALLEALRLGREMAARHGGWDLAPGWLDLEHARLLLAADSLPPAESAARLARAKCARPGGADALTGAQAELLLGMISVRRLDYDNADEHFRRTLELSAAEPSLAGLVSWMQVPWDLWSPREQRAFDVESDRLAWIDRWWRLRDPILATPALQENRLDYMGRVAEAWFSLQGVDLAVPGPLTDPGQIILRYGRPDEWSFAGGAGPFRTYIDPRGGYAIGSQFIQFVYRLPGPGRGFMQVLFCGNATGTRFTATDSLRGPAWPDWLPRYGFEERDERLNATTEILRRPGGGIRLVFCYDTWLPEYSLRYPLQGLRFDGEARVRMALLRPQGSALPLWREEEVLLDRETEVTREWPMRRRSGSQIVDIDGRGSHRLATQLVLRDVAGRVVAMSVDNGLEFSVDPFGERGLDASSLLLLNDLPDTLNHRQERWITPTCLASGPDLLHSGLTPRAERYFLEGEELAFYLEVYNLSRPQDVTDAELSVMVEHLDSRGEVDYSVGTRGPTMTLGRQGVGQWNIARSMGGVHFEPGKYRLRISVYDRQAERRVDRTVDFAVGTPDDLAERCGWDRLPLPPGVENSPLPDAGGLEQPARGFRTAEDRRPRLADRQPDHPDGR